MPRLLVLNNYSLERVQGEVARGEKPAHHLYGIDRFAGMGFEVETIPVDETRTPSHGIVARGLRALPPLGDVRQQVAALRRLAAGDLIYAPCQTQTQMLSYLRGMGLLRSPVVVLAHHPIGRSRWPWKTLFLRLQLRGTDAFPSLSSMVAREVCRLSRRSDLSEAVPWGPDLAYYPVPDGSPGTGAVAAGRTGRDFATFGLAAAKAKVPASIFCLRNDQTIKALELGPTVAVTSVEKESDLNYRTLVPALASARVHAIPLTSGSSLSGLTSLTDALGLGKPMIMTRQPLIDIDLEAEGIGRWVAPGDVEGWADALQWFATHPEEAVAMGKRARKLAEDRYNLDLFTSRMAAIFARILAGSGRAT
jgi:hypothetical protein